jgi:hypothetical protein
MMLERMPRFAELGKNRLDGLPEARAVVHFAQVRELVRDDVIDDRQRKVNQPPVEPDAAVARATPPACRRRRQRVPFEADSELLRIDVEALAEKPSGLAL